jgi:UDP-glucose 6-dehydrogenase
MSRNGDNRFSHSTFVGDKMKIGIVGHGVVGGAVADGFRKVEGITVSSHDRKFEGSKIDAVINTDVCFICVSAPTLDSGRVDMSSIYSVLSELSLRDYKGDVVIKSTVTPGSCAQMQIDFPKLIIVHNPEFLSERTAGKDFLHQEVCLISGREYQRTALAYHALSPHIHIMTSDVYADTELAKYIHNTFNALKVIFFNEIEAYQQKNSDFLDRDHSLPRQMAAAASHGHIPPTLMETPGHDGKYGFGGMCFPKDVKAFLYHAARLGVRQNLLDVVQNLNNTFRTKSKGDKL